jgi:hypothetical protein
MAIDRIGGETIVLYAELRERLEVFETLRSIATLPGEFTTKTVKGVLYHYFQAMSPTGRIQFYLGRDNKEIRQLIAAKNADRNAVLEDESLLKRLAAQIIAGDIPAINPDMARIIHRLADSAIFRAGGVLIGSVAFQILGTHLGVRLENALRTTQDIDIAGNTRISVAVPDERADMPATIESLHMGFFPVPRLSNKEPSTSYAIRGKTLRIDVLTPMKREESAPVFISRLNAAAQPLKYLDYLIEEPINAALVSGTPCLVKIPQPARFALHKLIVSQERNVVFADKKRKDIAQAIALLEVLKEDRPGDVIIAKEAVAARGASWLKKLERACKEATITL